MSGMGLLMPCGAGRTRAPRDTFFVAGVCDCANIGIGLHSAMTTSRLSTRSVLLKTGLHSVSGHVALASLPGVGTHSAGVTLYGCMAYGFMAGCDGESAAMSGGVRERIH